MLLVLGLALVLTSNGGLSDTLEGTKALLDLLPGLETDLGSIPVTEGIGADAEGSLGSENTGDLSLELGSSLTDEGGVEDETVLGGVVLGLEGAEEGLLRTEDLDGGGRALGQVHEGTGVGDEPGADELADHGREVGGDGEHAVLEVFVELSAVLADGDDLLSEGIDVIEVVLGDLSAHGDLGGSLDLGTEFLGEDDGKVAGGSGGAETEMLDNTGESSVVDDDLGELGEVPAVPFLEAHTVGVELLVEFVEETDGLDDHRIDLLRAELELEAGEGMGQTEGHGTQFAFADAVDEAGELGADTAIKFLDTGIGDNLQAELLGNGRCKLGVTHSKLLTDGLTFADLLLQEALKVLAEGALNQAAGLFKGLSSVLETAESLQANKLLGTLDSLEFTVELLDVLELAVLALEEGVASGCLVQNEHGSTVKKLNPGRVALDPCPGYADIVGSRGASIEREVRIQVIFRQNLPGKLMLNFIHISSLDSTRTLIGTIQRSHSPSARRMKSVSPTSSQSTRLSTKRLQ